MLVSIFRNAPLRHRLLKGYVVLGTDPAAVIASARHRVELPRLGATHFQVRDSSDHPTAVWIDTGPIWLSNPTERHGAVAALAVAVNALAHAVQASGGLLVPSATVLDARRRTTACEDRHFVEVLDDAHREVFTNLLRWHAAEVVALTGRSAAQRSSSVCQGSRRLAESRSQVATRYLGSASAVHLNRVDRALRRDERLAGLAVMDVDPRGDKSLGFDNVSVKCVDAQAFPTTAMAHAMLLEALAIQARAKVREGRRVPSGKPNTLDRNRSNAVARGLNATFEREGEQGERNLHRGRNQTRETVRVKATDAVVELIDGLGPELQALEATGAELLPLVSGLALRSHHADAVQTENDLFAIWARSRQISPEFVGGLLLNQEVLVQDQLSGHNRQVASGSVAALESIWEEQLRLKQRPSGRAEDKNGKKKPRGGDRREAARRLDRPRQHQSDRHSDVSPQLRTLVLAMSETEHEDQLLSLLRNYLAGGGSKSLYKAIRTLATDPAKLRRNLRGSDREVLVVRDPARIEEELGVTVRAAVHEKGRVAVKVEVPPSEQQQALRQILEFAEALAPDALAAVINNAKYPANGGDRVRIDLVAITASGFN